MLIDVESAAGDVVATIPAIIKISLKLKLPHPDNLF